MQLNKRLQVIQDNYETALSDFNFHKVKLVMDALDWTWAGFSTIPKVHEMEDCVHRLYYSALENIRKGKPTGYTASGGFVVQISEHNGVLIQFVAEESESSE